MQASVQRPLTEGGEQRQASHQPGNLLTDQAAAHRRSHPVPVASARRSRKARPPRAIPATQSAASTWPRSMKTPPADAAGEAGTAILPATGTDPLWVPSTAAA